MGTYEKVYFHDDYAKQFEELRSRYHERTQNALCGRKTDQAPMPNATTIVYLHDDGDGGISITTGDFVEYFNRRYGGKDRVGAVRRSLEQAKRRSELRGDADRAMRETRVAEKRNTRSFASRVRTASSRLAFLHAVFVLMLMLSVTMLLCSSLALKQTDQSVTALESEIAMLEGAQSDGVWLTDYNAGPARATEASYPAMDGADSVEIYAPDEEGVSGFAVFFNALASLGK